MKDELMESIPDILSTNKSFIVVTHVNPDGDAIGSLLGMHLALRDMGKQSIPVCRGVVPAMYRFLPGVDEIVEESRSNNGPPPWIISVDAATEQRISGDLSGIRPPAMLINIDHHPTNPGFGDLNLVDPKATSTAEIVLTVLKQVGYQLSVDVGKCLYTGLVTDTGGFRFSGVNARTMKLAAEMLESGFDSYDVTRHLFEEYPIRRLELERLLLDRIEILLDGRLVLTTLYADDFTRLGVTMADSENLVNRLRESSGVEVGVLLTNMSEELTRVSLRSKDQVDVSKIAASFGGGGHCRAAGIKSALPLADLKLRIIAAVREALLKHSSVSAVNV
jgi:bifunctional oligoribonuclease and PAP phosphatase NrnA